MTTELDEDIAEIIISHFPNASRRVMEEMLVEFRELLIAATKTEFDRGVVYGLRKARNYLDSQPDMESVRKLVNEALSSNKGETE